MVDGLDSSKTGEEVAGRYRVLVENANDGMIIVDPESGRITFANPALAKIFGYAITELEGLSVFDLHFPEDHPKAKAVLDRCLRGDVVAEQLPAKKKDGERIWVEIKPALAQLEGRKIALSIVRDITQSVELAEELRASESSPPFGPWGSFLSSSSQWPARFSWTGPSRSSCPSPPSSSL